MAIWHIGDPHFGHAKSAKYRGFYTPSNEADVEAHDSTIYNSITAHLSDGDTVIFYGDLSFIADWKYALNLVEQLKRERQNLTFWLLPGNHDMIHPMFEEKILEAYPYYTAIFDWIGERFYTSTRYPHPVYLSHFPAINGDDTHSQKYERWQLPGAVVQQYHGAAETPWVIHAHTHQKTFAHRSRPHHLCVSWDVFRAPVSDAFLTRAINGELDNATYYENVAHWGELEQYRAQAVALQQVGGE